MNIAPGDQLSHYRLIEKVSEGGMGVVWKALDTTLERPVALKVLPEDFANDRERLARFEHEARILATLNHPNIVTVYSVESADDVRFLTMEWVPGQTLDQLIPSRGLPLSSFVDLAVPLVDGIITAHRKGVTHRDLKPTNVMLSETGRIKVLDFGLARHTVDTAAVPSTKAPTRGFHDD
ncbi:MAG: serine/threonine protein kinase, partial [Nitrospirota bacterium]|nr:serine/threonine protein kinase [Nitrospirota bacterium]